MKTSRVIENAEKKVRQALALVMTTRQDASANGFREESWYEVASGELQTVLTNLMDDLEAAHEDVLDLEGDPRDTYTEYVEKPREVLQPVGHDYDGHGEEKQRKK